MGNTNWKRAFKIIFRILIIVVIILAVAVTSLAGTFVVMRWHRDVSEKESGEKNFIEKLVTSDEKKKEPMVTCLFLGVNGNLTDFIMLGQYDPNTREIDLLSIPRDTNVGNASIDGKINSVKSSNGKNGINKIKEQVTKITGIEVNHYVIFKTKILRELVNEIGGVTVDVPINMNYDDPYQNLHIHLKKGTQKLTGSQAEQFVRFRKNNDGSGYARGDVERTKTQQKFILAFINELLKAENISKVSSLINIVLDGTETDVTFDVAKGYIDDVIALRTDRINTNTAPGEGKSAKSPLGYVTSYYFINETELKQMVNEMFHNTSSTQEIVAGGVTNSATNELKTEQSTIRIELLNGGTTTQIINGLVNTLNESGFYVVKIGNYETTKKEASKIIDHGTASDLILDKLKKVAQVTKTESSPEESSVDYTIIIGPYY